MARQAVRKHVEGLEALTLTTSVFTRWNSVWICACNLLDAMLAFMLLLAKIPQTVPRVLASKDKWLDKLRTIFVLLESSVFLSSLEWYRKLLVPSVESSLFLQDGDATLAGVVYCRLH